ncbi:MAG: 4-(cytidine 5'-diphospho)-2-C-methyl-D-erythritol kinase [Chloroflexi bacterium]|nr:4-(cytidine 5'-diphospho)-2-C-methyl-D-erythritol kinase [Chloroflexota bacterium]
MTRLSLPAYAKINLTLEVLGKRPDGYHEIASIIQTIDLADVLVIEEAEEIEFSCDLPEIDNPSNLVVQAAELLRKRTDTHKGARILLRKRIPLSAGLGGGSSDAASALVGLNELWGLSLPREELLAMASELGADVPFFLSGGTALVESKGERVLPLPPFPSSWVVLLKHSLQLESKTKRLYESLRPEHFTLGESTYELWRLLRHRSDITLPYFHNVFELVAFDIFPGLKEHWEQFLAAGAESVHLAGTGPTLFSLEREKERAEEVCSKLMGLGFAVHLAKTL